MATTAPTPLTEAEEAKLAELQARQTAVQTYQDEQDRQQQLERLGPLAEVVGGEAWDNIITTIKEHLPAQDGDTVLALSRVLTVMENEGAAMKRRVASLQPPPAQEPAPTPPPE